jgi:hypothetical protein
VTDVEPLLLRPALRVLHGSGCRTDARRSGAPGSSTDTDLSLFFSRDLAQEVGEDLVEKQNAELGLMPVVTDETAVYDYVEENRASVRTRHSTTASPSPSF